MDGNNDKIFIRNNSQNRPNKLITEKSPYLLQHAFNPVDWYSWGNEAFERAKKENKPIFLSIGYSTCHWCHVMAHESFEDLYIGKMINDAFVSIKVDREERPDIDNIYMTVCQMMTGSGGWPLTILMTPDKKPFFAGTYFPKETRSGRIGLIDLIKKVKDLWNNQKIEITNLGDQIAFALKNITQESPGNKINKNTLKKGYDQLKLQFDAKNGGFGDRPKFPTPHNLLFLLRFWKRTGSKEALEMVEKSIHAMRSGGIYDHIGFGIHRYSTDSHWLVPHFEKMLYDQALLAMACVEAYQATKNPEYSKIAQEIFAYVLRDMSSFEGGFFSAEDADSEGVEGKFYKWSKNEIENLLEKDEAEITIKVFNIENSGNYLEEATQRKTGNNILHLDLPLATLSKELHVPEQELRVILEKVRKKLLNARNKRVHPHKDDKILTDWNGLMVAALAKGAQAFYEPLYLETAKKTVDFILSKLRKPNGRLLHRYREQKAEFDAYLADYAFFIWGLIELYETTFDINYLKNALELNKVQIEHFWDNNIGGFYFTADDSEDLLTRQKEIYDGAIPSGNSVALLNLLRLALITGDLELEEKADVLSRIFAEKIESVPAAHTHFLIAIDFAVGPTYSLVIAGNSGSKDTNELISSIRAEYFPNKVIIHRPTEDYRPNIDEFSNFIKHYNSVDGKAIAYACVNKSCKTPTNNINKIKEFLTAKWDSN